jgi:tripartite-type tricarboxylate transporter receptor subunit TctC
MTTNARRQRAARVAALPLAVLLAGCGSTTPSEAASDGSGGGADCSSLEGRNVRLVVPYSPGGGYDVYARMIAPALGRALDANVVVENQPGAGGLLAVNGLVNAEPDGTRIALVNGTGLAASILGGAEGATFDFDDLSYLGRVGAEDSLVLTAASGPYDTWEDVVESDGFRFGSSGVGASDYILPTLLMEAFPLDGAEIITGFPGQSEVLLALAQGDVDGLSKPGDTSRPGIEAGDHVPVLSMTMDPPADYASDATYVGEMDLDERQEMLLTSHVKVNEMGRPLVAPPGMDEGTLTCLRDAWATAAEDDELLEEAEAKGTPIAFVPGAEMQEEIVQDVKDLPEEYLTVLRSGFEE